MPVMSTGRPPGSAWWSRGPGAPRTTATTSSIRVRIIGTSSARNASGKIRSTPSSVASGIADPSRKPPNVARFQVTNRLSSTPSRNGKARSPVPEATPNASSVRKNAATGRCRRLRWNWRPTRDAVEQMADVEEKRRQDDLGPCRARREQADGGELGAAGEDERRKRLRLDERETCAAGRDGIRERERNDAEPERHHREEAASERAVVSSARPSARS